MAGLKGRNDGTAAQDKIQAALKIMESRSMSTFIRLYDSKSAGFGSGGNIIPENPSDFIVSYRGRTAIIEVKSSVTHRSLKDCTLRSLFRSCQMLGAYLWTRAGNQSWTAFYSVESGYFEFWPTMKVREYYLAEPRHRKLQGEPAAVCGDSEEDLAYTISTLIAGVL